MAFVLRDVISVAGSRPNIDRVFLPHPRGSLRFHDLHPNLRLDCIDTSYRYMISMHENLNAKSNEA